MGKEFDWKNYKFIQGKKLENIYESKYLDFKQFPVNLTQKNKLI
jgi:hypothetical protein